MCLIQVATDAAVIVYHCQTVARKVTDGLNLPESLVWLLAEPSIVKAGCAIFEDAQNVMEDFGVQMGGLQDLDLLGRMTGDLHGSKWGLRQLAERFLNISLDKNPQIRKVTGLGGL